MPYFNSMPREGAHADKETKYKNIFEYPSGEFPDHGYFLNDYDEMNYLVTHDRPPALLLTLKQ